MLAGDLMAARKRDHAGVILRRHSVMTMNAGPAAPDASLCRAADEGLSAAGPVLVGPGGHARARPGAGHGRDRGELAEIERRGAGHLLRRAPPAGPLAHHEDVAAAVVDAVVEADGTAVAGGPARHRVDLGFGRLGAAHQLRDAGQLRRPAPLAAALGHYPRQRVVRDRADPARAAVAGGGARQGVDLVHAGEGHVLRTVPAAVPRAGHERAFAVECRRIAGRRVAGPGLDWLEVSAR